MMFTNSFWAVNESLSNTPHSRSKLPNIRKPTNGREIGAIKPATIVMMIGKRIFVILDTPSAL
ncbi:hypothetical protein SDC9_102188 [bioreactor metagenome]|uniref:Uncharacterized protein n=1 Tax=bioreactor metagenome TaxID=1076179 RepID=A0A645AQ52_9ZZZZ